MEGQVWWRREESREQQSGGGGHYTRTLGHWDSHRAAAGRWREEQSACNRWHHIARARGSEGACHLATSISSSTDRDAVSDTGVPELRG